MYLSFSNCLICGFELFLHVYLEILRTGAISFFFFFVVPS